MTYHHQRRLDRALHHLRNLESEIDEWFEDRPYRTWTETDYVGDRPMKFFYCQVLRKPPSELSLIIGDCLHNFRSALDNLVYEIAVRCQRGPLPPKVEKALQFPIHGTRKGFKNSGMGRINSLALGAIKEIVRLQPYRRGDKFASDPLWQLNELSIRDKHRLPPVASLPYVRSLAHFVPDRLNTSDVQPLHFAFEGTGILVCYPAFDKTGAEVQDIEFNPILTVGFSHLVPKQLIGRQIPELLQIIHRHITNQVLPPLQPFLRDR
jgi:hypothetical protein